MISPEQMRKKSLAQAESLRHKRFAEVDQMRSGEQVDRAVPRQEAAMRHVAALAREEEALIGKNILK